jgi:hypothetical protein
MFFTGSDISVSQYTGDKTKSRALLALQTWASQIDRSDLLIVTDVPHPLFDLAVDRSFGVILFDISSPEFLSYFSENSPIHVSILEPRFVGPQVDSRVEKGMGTTCHQALQVVRGVGR